ncbi:MAG: hypothetical protein MI755_08790 [Sphingomonadales bacterium]|nr:hypothetical protein [Sphingomonadales bacterium]
MAERSGVGPIAIFKFEAGKTSPHRATLKALKDAFEEAGVIFIAENEGCEPARGAGARLND